MCRCCLENTANYLHAGFQDLKKWKILEEKEKHFTGVFFHQLTIESSLLVTVIAGYKLKSLAVRISYDENCERDLNKMLITCKLTCRIERKVRLDYIFLFRTYFLERKCAL